MAEDKEEKTRNNDIFGFLNATKHILPIVYATIVVVGGYYAMDKRVSVWEDRMRQHDIQIQKAEASIEAVRAHNNVQDLNFTAFKSSTDVKLDNIEKTTVETYELVKSYTRGGRN